jgi:rhamnosyltransferase subunit B
MNGGGGLQVLELVVAFAACNASLATGLRTIRMLSVMGKSPLRILVAALGSYGDVHPFLAIAKELKNRGHDVRVLMPAMYEGLAKSLNLTFVPIGTVEQFDEFSSRPELWKPIQGFQVVAEGAGEMLRPYYEAIVANHDPGRTVVVFSTLVVAARIARETLGIPGVGVHLSPACFRSVVEPNDMPLVPITTWTPVWWNRFVFWAADFLVTERALGGPLNRFRKSLGLGPAKKILAEWIHSPDCVVGLFPRWFAPPPPDWPRQARLTGFPLYDEADVTPVNQELEEFLQAGTPPIAFTPGSAMRHGDRFFDEAVGMCQMLGRRGIFLSRHRQHVPENLPKEILHVEFAPFGQLLPRCAAIVHHGGIGTSAQGMAAGIPHLVVAMAHDQPDNGRRLKRLGVADVIPAKRFSAERGAEAMGKLLDEEHRAACKKVRGLFSQDNPFLQTADFIEALHSGVIDASAQPL